MNRRRLARLMLFAGVLLLPRALVAEQRPIIAVFPIEAKGIALPDDALDRLTDYLASSLTATGRFGVVPRAALKRRLVAQKRESYRRCYDQSCQIEIGREVAAQKSVSTQIIRLGSRCAVTTTLYDLKRAAGQRGATAKGGCAEDEIVGSLERVVARLVGTPSAASQPAATPAARASLSGATPPRVVVELRSHPTGAWVKLDGKVQGQTPLRLQLPRGGNHDLLLQHSGYRALRARLAADRDKRIALSLAPLVDELERSRKKAAARHTATEWFAMEFLAGYISMSEWDPGAGYGGLLSIATLKWQHFYWTILDVGGVFSEGLASTYLSTRLGYPLYLGARRAHQLRLGMGLGLGIDKGRDEREAYGQHEAFFVSPAVHYLYQSAGRFFFGLGVRAPIVSGESYGLFGAVLFGFSSR